LSAFDANVFRVPTVVLASENTDAVAANFRGTPAVVLENVHVDAVAPNFTGTDAVVIVSTNGVAHAPGTSGGKNGGIRLSTFEPNVFRVPAVVLETVHVDAVTPYLTAVSNVVRFSV
jgi:hypothetical protein